jgi:hypothetical protein
MKRQPELKVEVTETDIFVHIDGKLIAKRGHPCTPQAETWVSLEPGYQVLDNKDKTELIVLLNGTRIH